MARHRIQKQVDQPGIERLAGLVAFKLRAGDTVALSGDLGSGKTTFARALIRASLGDAGAEVPSPTFSLVQTYASPRFEIAHLDLYRIAHDDEILELDLEEAQAGGVLVVEWAERVPSLLGVNRLDIHLGDGGSPETRSVAFTGSGSWVDRLARVEDLVGFLEARPDWDSAEVRYLQGDASVRAYGRVKDGPSLSLLMDWPRQPDGPPIRDGLPYSRIAHLAEDMAAFVAIADLLRANGFKAPQIFEADLGAGFLLTEDFGDRVFGREVAAGNDLEFLWHAATDVLVRLRRLRGEDVAAVSVRGGGKHAVPLFDRGALGIETELLLDWYWPLLKGVPVPSDARAAFCSAWEPLFSEVLSVEPQLVLRDFHSPNLIWCDDGGDDPADHVGLIDFQDAVRGHAAYDLVSLLQDARLDVAVDIERDLLAHYCDSVTSQDPEFDKQDFERAYAILGAQRNTKILGIFARLAVRDGKHAYLSHVPRIWGYLERNLAHSGLAGLRAWYDKHFPDPVRCDVPKV